VIVLITKDVNRAAPAFRTQRFSKSLPRRLPAAPLDLNIGKRASAEYGMDVFHLMINFCKTNTFRKLLSYITTVVFFCLTFYLRFSAVCGQWRSQPKNLGEDK